jgi:hypothetical protein
MLSSIVLVNTRSSRDKARIAKALEFSQTISHVLGSEAVGIWNFDGCNAQDSSGYGNNGTITGASCSTETPYSVISQGSNQHSMSFDGVDDYINNSNCSNLSRDKITFMFWSKQLETKSYFMHHIGIFGGHYATVYVSPNSYTYVYKFSDIGGVRYEAAFAVLNSEWHHIAITFDGLQIKCYADGILQITQDAPGSIIGGDNSLFVGNSGYGSSPSGNWFYGIIDNVNIYSQSLNQSQIQQHYAEGLKDHNSNI